MAPGKFDCEKARELADELLDMCAADDDWLRRIAMTLRAACNEVDAYRIALSAMTGTKR